MKRYLYIWIALLAAVKLSAQETLPHTYYCDFEDEAENANWNLNKPKNENYVWVNQWTIDTLVSSLGKKSLYITPDEGEHVGYARTESRVMIAWREMTLEEGRYDIAFDWMCGGDSSRACMIAAWVPEDQFENMYCKLNDDYKATKWINNNLLTFNGSEVLNGGSVWSHAVDTLRSDGKPHRLVFLFVYSSAARLIQPGPCVDNIEIARNNCGAPTDMKSKLADNAVTLTWASIGESFNLRLHRMGENVATILKGFKTPTFSYTLPEGVYDIQIQVVCEGDTSVWYNFPPVFVYETKCFDYLDLTDENCFFSEETAANYHDNDNLPAGKIDFGFTSMWSRHTIHYHPEEYDMHTYGSYDSDGNPVAPLKTVPNGALASVRLGSWEEMARVARIEYEFEVNANEASVLMLQYALVLQASGHDEAARPRLTIDIVDAADGSPLSPCTTVDLAAQTTGPGWYRVPMYGPTGPEDGKDVCWRDWTTLGLNLVDHDQKRVKVIITSLGCTAEIHYGYAYFTLTCTSGKIRGVQCGWTPTNEFIAPEGFNYRWYLVDNPDATLGTEQTFQVDYTDIRDYAVDVTYKSNEKCGFTLTANAIPRFPIPRATYKLEQKDCGNYITFTNKSHIQTRNWITKEKVDTPLPPEYITWDFDGLRPEELNTAEALWNPSFRLPDEEKDYHFQLTAGVGLCDSTQHIYVHVPAVGPDSIVEEVQKCEGDLFNWQGKYYQTDTTIIDRDYNKAGCDSTHVIVLSYVKAIYTTVDAVIPEGEVYELGNQKLTKTGTYTENFQSESGCDSIVTLNLRVVEPLEMEITSIEHPCPEAVSFLIETHARRGIPDYYKLQFDENGYAIGLVPQTDSLKGGADNAIEVPMPAGVKPGYYPFSIAFESKENGKAEVEGELTIYYSASIIQQRWDDVLGILNWEKNGGYDFREFQWYRNGQLIDGATDAYYYEEGKLQPGDEYLVELKLPGEERGLKTCAFVVPASAHAPAAQQKILQDGNIYFIIDGRTYNAQGQLIGK